MSFWMKDYSETKNERVETYEKYDVTDMMELFDEGIRKTCLLILV